MIHDPHDDAPLLLDALDIATDVGIHLADLDQATRAAIRRWPVAVYSSGLREYVLTADIEALVDVAHDTY